MDSSETFPASSPARNQSEDAAFLEAYNQEMLRQAEVQCEMVVRRANIKKLTEDIRVLAKEVKEECLIEKWGNTPMMDGTQRVKPEIQARTLCKDILANPEQLDEIMMHLQYQKAKLQSQVAQVMSKLKDYEVTD